jgi:hypothetical protein
MQVITVAVYIFVIACLIGRRETDDGFRGDFNFPFFTLVNIIVYVGWMKVSVQISCQYINFVKFPHPHKMGKRQQLSWVFAETVFPDFASFVDIIDMA